MNDSGVPGLNVSRETSEKLKFFHGALLKWTSKINLISKSSIDDIWSRHIWDSAQLVPLKPEFDHWVDIGSGGGFPGLIIAIFSSETHVNQKVTLVESDQRKSAFLRSVIRDLQLNAHVITDRVEEIDPLKADVLSARALASLNRLLEFSERHLSDRGMAYFLKGKSWEKEVQVARDSWSFKIKAHKSNTNSEAAILEVKEIERV